MDTAHDASASPSAGPTAVRPVASTRSARTPLLALVALAVAYGLLELVVQLAWSPEVVQPFEEAAREMPAEELRAAREQAGLGFRDPGQTVHPYLGFVYVPPADGTPTMLPISEEGFLCAGSVFRERSPGKLVIGLTGGSVAGQLGSFHGAFLETALRAHEAFAEKELEFVWLGMPGYHQPQQALLLNWLLAQGAEFDAFVNLDGFNEIAVGPVLNAPRGTHPLYPMNWSMVALDVPDLRVRRLVGAIEHVTRERREAAAAFVGSSWTWSPLARLLAERRDRAATDRLAAYEAELAEVSVPDEVPWFVRGPERDHAPMEELVDEGARVWERASRQLDAVCRAHGIRYVHVLQPNQYDPGSKPLSDAEREVAYQEESPYKPAVERGYPLLREAGERLVADGVVFRDLSGVFADVEEPLYADVCCHFGAEGNRLLSIGIAQALADAFAG